MDVMFLKSLINKSMKIKLSFFCQDCVREFTSRKHFKLPNTIGIFCHCPKCNSLCNNSDYLYTTTIYNYTNVPSKFDNNDSVTNMKIVYTC